MKTRWLRFLLAAAILLGTVSLAVVPAEAASMKTSEACIGLIKQMEGFVEMPVLDYSQYSIGYGSACDPADYPNGITEAEADQLLRKDVAGFEAKVNNFAEKNGLSLSQQQFDALISFTYNVGSSWMSDTEGMFRSAVVEQAGANDFIFAIVRWSTAGEGENKAVQVGLVKRRLIEANMYLNGVYNYGVPANYTYVIYNNNLDDVINTIRVQGYDSTLSNTVRATPTRSGYRFLGWYTAAEGGACVTDLDYTTGGMTLYGHWQQGDGQVDENGKIVGVSAEYSQYASGSGEQVLREQPSEDAAALRTLEANESITIVAEYMDASGVKWGQLPEGGWVDLSQTSTDIEASEELTDPVLVTVTSSEVNIRQGPGTNYQKVGKAYKGQQLTITGVQENGKYLWGKFSGGWIRLDYTDYDTAIQDTEEPGEVIATGTIVNCDVLRVRSGPGTSYQQVDTLASGTKVEIYEYRTSSGATWARISGGWIHMDYVELDKTEDAGNDDSGGTKATVVNCTKVNVRNGPGTHYNKVGELAVGTQVEILKTSGVWAETSYGWIHTDYLEIAETGSFRDVTTQDYFYDAVEWAVKAGVTTGLSETKFGPDDNCSRGQMVTFLWRAAGKPEHGITENPFTDVKETDYYYDAILWALEQGITTGLTESTFGPEETCTRGQVVTFLWRSAGKTESTAANPFLDVNDTQYYYDSILWAVDKGITTGLTATTFGPDENCTRGQIVTFLYRAAK